MLILNMSKNYRLWPSHMLAAIDNGAVQNRLNNGAMSRPNAAVELCGATNTDQ